MKIEVVEAVERPKKEGGSGSDGAKPDEKGGIGNGADEERIKGFINDFLKEKKPQRNREYLDFAVGKFWELEKRAGERDDYTDGEREAFFYGFYAAAGGISATVEKWLRKDGATVTSANKAREAFETLREPYPTKAEVERHTEYLHSYKAEKGADDGMSRKLKSALTELEGGYATRTRLEEQFDKGTKYGSFFSIQMPGVGWGYMGVDLAKYIKDGGWEHVYERGKDAGGLIKDGVGSGIGKLRDLFGKKGEKEDEE